MESSQAFCWPIARAAGETAPLLFTALGNERYDLGQIVQSGVAQKQGLFTILQRIFDQPVDSLPLTLWKYAQQPYPERIQQSWAAALVLMIVILLDQYCCPLVGRKLASGACRDKTC